MTSSVNPRPPGFKGEYLWEFDYAERQLLAMAEAFAAESYGWRAAETARSVSEILVHIAAGSRMLLAVLGVDAAHDLYGMLEGEGGPRIMAMIKKNESLEKSVTDKPAVIALLRGSLDAWRKAFTDASDSELNRPLVFFGEQTTVRRLYLRGLTHMHEHMGQLTAYTRASGMPAPWEAERKALRKTLEQRET